MLKSARDIGDFLYAESVPESHKSKEAIQKALEKRIIKLNQIDWTQDHATVEYKKRLLQIATLALKALENV